MKFITIILIVIYTALTGLASDISSTQAIKGIVGESANQGYKGMLAVAGAIRNRGTLTGVYGFYSRMANNQPDWVWKQAAKAWAESATNDITGGATHWESTDFRKPAWASKMKVTAHIGKHIFYKP